MVLHCRIRHRAHKSAGRKTYGFKNVQIRVDRHGLICRTWRHVKTLSNSPVSMYQNSCLVKKRRWVSKTENETCQAILVLKPNYFTPVQNQNPTPILSRFAAKLAWLISYQITFFSFKIPLTYRWLIWYMSILSSAIQSWGDWNERNELLIHKSRCDFFYFILLQPPSQVWILINRN